MITVQYTCELCGLRGREVLVPERGDEADVKKWMDGVMECVAADHADVSSQCKATHLTQLKIPINTEDPDARVGDPVRKK